MMYFLKVEESKIVPSQFYLSYLQTLIQHSSVKIMSPLKHNLVQQEPVYCYRPLTYLTCTILKYSAHQVKSISLQLELPKLIVTRGILSPHRDLVNSLLKL